MLNILIQNSNGSLAGFVELVIKSIGLRPLLFLACGLAPNSNNKAMNSVSCFNAASCKGVLCVLTAFTLAPDKKMNPCDKTV